MALRLKRWVNKIFMYLWAPFILQNLKKVLRADPELSDVPFLGPKWPICPEQFFFCYKPLFLLSSTYWPYSLCKIKKKFWLHIQSYEDAQFLGPKLPICSNEDFYRKPVNKPCFFHSCLTTSQKSSSDFTTLEVLLS